MPINWPQLLSGGMMTAGAALNPRMAPPIMQHMQNQQNMAFRIKQAEEERQYRNRVLELREEELEATKEHRKALLDQQKQWEQDDKHMLKLGELTGSLGITVPFTPETIPAFMQAANAAGIPADTTQRFIQASEIYGDGRFIILSAGRNKRMVVEARPHKYGGEARLKPYTEKGKTVIFGEADLTEKERLLAQLEDIDKKLREKGPDGKNKVIGEERLNLERRRELLTDIHDLRTEEEKEDRIIDKKRRHDMADRDVKRAFQNIDIHFGVGKDTPIEMHEEDIPGTRKRYLQMRKDAAKEIYEFYGLKPSQKELKHWTELPPMMSGHRPPDLGQKPVRPEPSTRSSLTPEQEAKLKATYPDAQYEPRTDTWYVIREGKRRPIIISKPIPK